MAGTFESSTATAPVTFTIGLSRTTLNQTNLAGTQTAADEIGNPATLQTIANFRKTIGMSGSGFIENAGAAGLAPSSPANTSENGGLF